MDSRATKILYTVAGANPGGCEHQLRLLLNHLDRRVVAPSLAIWGADETQPFLVAFRQLDLPVHEIPRASNRWVRLRQLREIAAETGAEYVHSYSFGMNAPAWWVGRRIGARGVMGSIRSDFLHDRSTHGPLLGRLCAALPPHMIANSGAAERNVAKVRSPFKPKRVWVVPNGVDTEEFHPATKRDGGGGKASVRILGVGRLSEEKRWSWLIDILGQLHQDKTLPDWSLTICGDGPERENVTAAIQRNFLEQRVTLAGYQRDVAERMRASEILVLCSSYEGTPNVIAEGLACGIPAVTTDVGDASVLVRTGTDGFVVPVDGHQEFGKALRTLIASPELRKRMGLSGRTWMEAMRGPERLVENTLRAYREAGWDITAG